jgi:hypothetical protein
MHEHRVIILINYKELKKDDVIYMKNKYVAYKEGYIQYETKPFHKCIVFSVWEKDGIYIDIAIMGDIFCHSFPKTEETNHLFITEIEYKKMKMTEKKVWTLLSKSLSMINLLDNASDELIKVKELILKNNK